MKILKKIVVCVDNTAFDDQLISSVNKLAKGETEELIFIHVIPELNIPDEVKSAFPDFQKKIITERKEKIQERLTNLLHENILSLSKIEILNGSTAKSIVKFTKGSNVDLIIAGNKNTSIGVIKSRLARRADCSFLMIKEGIGLEFTKILVPIDFSDYSTIALNNAIKLANILPQKVEIIAQNVYEVPLGYSHTGKTFEEFSAIMKKNAQANYQKFIKTIDTKGFQIKPVFSLDENEDFVSNIVEETQKNNAGLIILGAKGQTPTFQLLIGSKAERIIMMDVQASMMVVRKQGEKYGIKDVINRL